MKAKKNGFINLVYNNNIMLIMVTIILLFILSISVIHRAKADQYKTYEKSFASIEIEQGDTLTSIAEKYAVSPDSYDEYIEEVISINNLKSDTIHYGCYLIVPQYR